nr:metal-dependent transcriptional regulator [uncultured Niameybacter sp.]
MILGQSGEDYLETVLELEQLYGVVRSIDIAKKLNVSRPSVNKAINNLKEAGMVTQQSYGDIKLTDLGRKTAKDIIYRHTLIKKFLTYVLGLSPQIAEADACKIEHILSPETIEKLEDFIINYKKCPNRDV